MSLTWSSCIPFRFYINCKITMYNQCYSLSDMEKTNEIHLKKQISFRLSSRPLFCIVENENNTFDQRYMWNTLTIVGSCINLASGKLFVLSWRQNDKKSICFRYYRKTRFEIKRYDTNFIYNKISMYFHSWRNLLYTA